MAAKLVSMKRSAKDKREDKMEQAPMDAMVPDYPYGLCIHLDKDELDKLGIDASKVKVGTEVTISAKAKVTRVSQSSADAAYGGEDQSSVDYQITDVAIG